MKINKLNYVVTAESVIKSLLVRDRQGREVLYLTTSKIRNILSMVSELYNEAIHIKEDTISEDLQSSVQYLKMRIAYEAGRDKNVASFEQKAQLMQILNTVGNSKENLILFCNYMEALVAYHKFYGGRD